MRIFLGENSTMILIAAESNVQNKNKIIYGNLSHVAKVNFSISSI